MAKKQAKPEEPAGESAPMWIVSFADLVTLMMSFFVVLYALKQGGKEQEIATAVAIADRFSWTPDESADDPYAREWRRRHGREFIKQAGSADVPALAPEGRHEKVETMRPGKEVSGGTIRFELNSVELDAEARATVAKLFEIVRGKTNVLMIKGHVSADEAALRNDDLNAMNLSYRRAVAVCDALTKLGMDRRVLRPVACGPFEPVKVGVYDAAGLRQNRRVEIYATDTVATDYFPATFVPAPPPEPAATQTAIR